MVNTWNWSLFKLWNNNNKNILSQNLWQSFRSPRCHLWSESLFAKPTHTNFMVFEVILHYGFCRSIAAAPDRRRRLLYDQGNHPLGVFFRGNDDDRVSSVTFVLPTFRWFMCSFETFWPQKAHDGALFLDGIVAKWGAPIHLTSLLHTTRLNDERLATHHLMRVWASWLFFLIIWKFPLLCDLTP